MWACDRHMKEILPFLETPHISKASYHIKCSLCDSRALVKVYYTHQPLQLKKNKKLRSLA
jgi:DNA-directed RNA polymerase subunit RPC12/RpoP